MGVSSMIVITSIDGIKYRRIASLAKGEMTVKLDYIPRTPKDLVKYFKASCHIWVFPRKYLTPNTARSGLAHRLKCEIDDITHPSFENAMDAAAYGLTEGYENGVFISYMSVWQGLDVEYMFEKYDELDDKYYIYYILRVSEED